MRDSSFLKHYHLPPNIGQTKNNIPPFKTAARCWEQPNNTRHRTIAVPIPIIARTRYRVDFIFISSNQQDS